MLPGSLSWQLHWSTRESTLPRPKAQVPREHKVEHSNPIKDLTDEQLEAMIEYIKTSLEAQAGGSIRVIEGTIEPEAATAHALKPKNRLMLDADTAVGPRERMPRKVRPPAGE